VRHNKYKTKLCQKFWILGYCAYGPRQVSIVLSVPHYFRGGRGLGFILNFDFPGSRVIFGSNPCDSFPFTALFFRKLCRISIKKKFLLKTLFFCRDSKLRG
jgi:hypothetical protein